MKDTTMAPTEQRVRRYPEMQDKVALVTGGSSFCLRGRRRRHSTGVRITAVCPGWAATPPVTRWMERDAKAAAAIVGQTPRGRIASADEIANAVLWLCSDAASFMIGSPLVVDGGYMG